MGKKTVWIAETAAMLAMLIALQWLGSQIPEQLLKQLITGTCVNAVLAVTVLIVGCGAGVTLSLISPVMAFVLMIAPNIVTVIPIMIGNVCYVLLLQLLVNKSSVLHWKGFLAVGSAAVAKFVVLYLLVVQVICGIAAPDLLGQKVGETVVLAPKMLEMLPAMFTWPQLITAFSGGLLALLIVPALGKALHKR